ncbi:MAG: J domain-containing protein [Coriobacteriales bacterium]|jgi:hypothetical protein|nr:J domain-containing protein [Coriobacteriales bacterium]
MTNNSVSLQEHPDVSDLKQCIAQTKEQIIEVLAAIDYTRFQQNPRIEAEYALKIGCYENELLKSEIAARRAKRKSALAQKALNAGETIDEQAIEGELDRELEEWYQKLLQTINDYQRILDERNNSRELNERDSKELSHLYRRIVKRLHPDINPAVGEQELRLFEAAQVAYGNGDLAAMRAIAVTAEGLGEAADVYPESEDIVGILEAELSMQKATLEVLGSRLDTLKDEYPYTMLSKLCDREWVLGTVRKLKEQIERHREVEQEYTRRLAALLSRS